MKSDKRNSSQISLKDKRLLALFTGGMLLPLLLAGCAGGGGGSGGTANGFDGSYQGSSSISALQEFQNVSLFTSGGSKLTGTVHPYDLTGVSAAYGYGLSGNGKTIAILDTGFNSVTSYSSGTAFAEMQSKRNTGKIVINGSLLESSNNHGNLVASLAAAGLDSQGHDYFENVTGAPYPTFVGNTFDELNHGMHGVAYNATLHLSEFDAGGMSNYTSATNRARSAGAVVQNNSWGLPSSPGNINTTALTIPPSYSADVAAMNASDASAWLGTNTPYSTGEWQNYYNALKNFQTGGVIVFALTNQTASSRASLMAALPSVYPDLGNAWIAVGNVNVSGNAVTRRSAKCLEAAPYCVMADGTEVTGAGVQNTEGYAIGRSGSSFAAPQVSGMIALLAEAFPNLSPQDLTTRLLATANNRFFTPTATRTFAGGVSHDFNEEFGHGIPDMVAALQPISTSDRPTGIVLLGSAMLGERIPLSRTSVKTTGALGFSINSQLKDRNVVAYDALGAGFKFAVSDFVRGTTDTRVRLGDHLAKFSGHLALSSQAPIAFSLNSYSNPFAPGNAPINAFFSVGRSLSALSKANTEENSDHLLSGERDLWANEFEAGFIRTPLSAAFGLRVSPSSSIVAYSSNTARGETDRYFVPHDQHPINRDSDNTLGLAYKKDISLNALKGTLTFGGQFEYDAIRGTASSGALSLGQSTQSFYVAPELQTSAWGVTLRAGGSVAFSKVRGTEKFSSIIDSVEPLTSTEFYASAQKEDVFQPDDLAYLKVWQPEVIEAGSLNLALPSLSAPNEAITLKHESVSLKTPVRPLHFTLGYSKYIAKDTELNYEVFAFDTPLDNVHSNVIGGSLRLIKKF